LLQTYGRPISKTAESIDAIYQPNLLFQMTVSTSKDVNLGGIEALVGKVGPPAIASSMQSAAQRFFVAVPETRFNSFSQVALKPNGSVWPPSIDVIKFKLSVPTQPSLHTRQEWILLAENKLRGQAVDESVRTLVIQYAAIGLPVDTSDMSELASNGMIKVSRKPALGSVLIEHPGPPAPTTIKIYKTFTGSFAYKCS
jgi:hypothetical protein